ncbi:hypothetical protein [Elizabethkingia anophelis]|uniref:hypothetical protein n=1 Tax=Elizabethkingia anophelis TaxID=1117645 RepID=UPI00099560B2|nr:hypothetical protein [Elizabethkingia anophelis]AQW92941.1 hypothetical protein BBD30_01410 [Elizabethkingia anophelis]MDV3917699.1 hypothetical protein [Elizabethkingia anophelis]MDV4095656.1 hypothetical protein [Elizabethkingia anophelis]OPB61447.1 hypothetical protein BAS07_16850 [Elizabethkingia anophelis]HAY3591747.1 hypothetical protein [Elizabethkingia anophelis]
MKKITIFRSLVITLVIVAFISVPTNFLEFLDREDRHILIMINHSLTLLIGILIMIIFLIPFSFNDNKDVPISDQKPKEYCVITFYSIVNIHREQYKHAENSIIISEEADLLRIQSLGYVGESLPIYFNGYYSSLNIPAIDLVKELANKNGVSTLYDCFTFNFKL